MKASGAVAQGGIAALALVVAYATWQRPPERVQGDVLVLDLSRKEVETVRYDDGTRWAELKPGHGEGEPKVWVRVGSRPPPAPPDAGVSAVDAGTVVLASAKLDAGVARAPAKDGGTAAPVASRPPPPAPPPDRDLRGSDEAERALDSVAPLMAVRLLGTFDAAKLKEMGLKGSTRRLEIVAGNATSRFVVAPSAGGLTAPYLQSEPDGKVYVLSSPLINNLEAAGSRLVDRRLHAFRPEEVRGLTVEAQGKSREFTEVGSGPGAQLQPKGASAPDAFAKNWNDKLFRYAPLELLGRGEKPKTGEPTATVKVRYSDGKAPLGFVELGKSGPDVYERTEFTAGWVRLTSNAEDLFREAQKVVAPEGAHP